MDPKLYSILEALGYWGAPPVETDSARLEGPREAAPAGSFRIGPWEPEGIIRGASYLPARMLGGPADIVSALLAPIAPETASEFSSQAFVDAGADAGLWQAPQGGMSEGLGEILSALVAPSVAAKTLAGKAVAASTGLNVKSPAGLEGLAGSDSGMVPGAILQSPSGPTPSAPAIINKQNLNKPTEAEALNALEPKEKLLDKRGRPAAAMAFRLGYDGPMAAYAQNMLDSLIKSGMTDEEIARYLAQNSGHAGYVGAVPSMNPKSTGVVFMDNNMSPVMVVPQGMDPEYVKNQLYKAQDRYDMALPGLIDRAQFTPDGDITFAKNVLKPGSDLYDLDAVVRALGGRYADYSALTAMHPGTNASGVYSPLNNALALNPQYHGDLGAKLPLLELQDPKILQKFAEQFKTAKDSYGTFAHEVGHMMDFNNYGQGISQWNLTNNPGYGVFGRNFINQTRPDMAGSHWSDKPQEWFAELVRDRVTEGGVSAQHPEYTKFARKGINKGHRTKWDAALFGIPAALGVGSMLEPKEAEASDSDLISTLKRFGVPADVLEGLLGP